MSRNGRLLAGIAAGNARLYAEQWVCAVFALVEGGLADSELGVFCGVFLNPLKILDGLDGPFRG